MVEPFESVWGGMGFERVSGERDGRSVGRGRAGDRVDDGEVAQAVLEGRDGRQTLDAGDLLEEGAALVAEEVADTEGDAGEVHRQAALDVGVGRAGEHLVVAVEAVVAQLADDREL